MNCKYIFDFLELHIRYCKNIHILNKKLKGVKRIRQPAFPEVISEYVAMIYYTHMYNKSVKFALTGDLITQDKQLIEVKAFSSNGPTSFGPNECWDKLMFIDAKQFYTKKFKIYIVNLQNNSEKWKNIPVNSKETFEDHCLLGRRPRICFDKLQTVLKDDIQLIFDGSLTLKNDKLFFKQLL